MLTRHGKQIGVLQIKPSDPEAFLRSMKIHSPSSPSLDDPHATEIETLRSQVPPKYHDFLDVFSKSKADKLPEHNTQFDHHIHLEEGKQPPYGPLYNLSETESIALQEFLQENLTRNFI